MKKIFFAWLASIFAVVAFVSGSFAQEVMTVSGKDYNVFMLCLGDAGDYCQQSDFNQDTFQFHSDGSFEITSLEDQKEIIDSSDGNYNASPTSFNGDYTITIDFLLKKYEFSFSGFSIADGIILGQFTVTYFEFGGFPPAYDQKGEAQAFFLGIRK
ncbi:MAG: hypothetical protein NTV89_06830 [Proteobacteria bacterium]|nr:hypothetical protein [Pseudomonadota bacterium]